MNLILIVKKKKMNLTQDVKKKRFKFNIGCLKKYEFKIGCGKKLAKITIQDQKINNR